MFAKDPLRLDRDIAEFARRHRRFTAALVTSDAAEHAFELAPSGLDEELLRELEDAGDTDPIARPALRWLGFLLREQALVPETRRATGALYRDTHGLHRPEPGRFTLAAMRERALAEPAQREDWIIALAENGGTLAEQRRILTERRSEVSERLSIPPLLDPADASAVPALARSVLEVTDDAYAELEVRSWKTLLDAAIGASVPGEWPGRSSGQALSELVREGGFFDGLKPEGFEVPRMLGASSVLRGLYLLGAAIHDAAAPSRAPFVFTREPGGLRRSSLGALFALMPTKVPFAERRLGVGRARSRDYARQITAVALIGVREGALAALLGAENRSPNGLDPRSFMELFERALGFEPSPLLARTVFAGDRDAVRFRGLLLAARQDRALIETHDEDWFRNPRAVREIRAELETPPKARAELSELEEGARALGRLLLEGL